MPLIEISKWDWFKFKWHNRIKRWYYKLPWNRIPEYKPKNQFMDRDTVKYVLFTPPRKKLESDRL